MSVYKLHANLSNSDGIAQIDIQKDGIIKSCNLLIDSNAGSDQHRAAVEVSFMSSNTFETNDVKGSIAMLFQRLTLTTSGMADTAKEQYFGELQIGVNAGERIFLHGFMSGVTSGDVTAFLYVDDGVDNKPPRRRR